MLLQPFVSMTTYFSHMLSHAAVRVCRSFSLGV
jgi:hypothetical protein